MQIHFIQASYNNSDSKVNVLLIMCTMVLKETLSYYASNNGSVFCTFLDAAKAFDSVKYDTSFKQVVRRMLPAVSVRFLLNMYISHVYRV